LQHLSLGEALYRTGFGYDAHRLVKGRPLIIGGVEISHHMGLMGHSDADVLTHAVIDAILGGLSRGDIGRHFPDTDPAYKDMSSLALLNKVMTWVVEDGFMVHHVDTTIVAEKPKLAPYLKTMEEKLADVLRVETRQVNIKAKTTEGMGFCGREEGIAAFAAVSLIRTKNQP
jgi:2-C-methyl-D-erythritol 2,4-cyclodiphosphate synthase